MGDSPVLFISSIQPTHRQAWRSPAIR